ncbi:MAG TPA: hypothetical protein VGM92_06610, partial [Candidatus Kapabacteria bacterium]
MTMTSFFSRFSRYAFAVALILIIPYAAKAQWKQLGSTLHFNVYCMYFFDSTHGVAGGVGSIYNYANGAWGPPSTTPGDNPFYFTSIRYMNGNLYATSGAQYVWISDDSGKNWRNTTTPSNFAYDSYFVGDSLYSTQLGTFAELDTNICIRSNNNGSYPSYSSNGGRTWTTPSGGANIGGLGTYADTCRKMFFASSKQDSVFYSLDSGKHWKHCGPGVAWDIMNGSNDAVYHQDSTGVWVSVDGGTSWENIGGPTTITGDRSIFGWGNEGNYLVASSGGAVWFYNAIDTVLPTDPVTRTDTLESCPITRIPIYVRPFTKPWTIQIQMSSDGPQNLA